MLAKWTVYFKCGPIAAVHTLHPNFWRFVLILSSNTLLGLPSGLCTSGLPSGLFPSGLPIKVLYALILKPYVLHGQSISFAFIWRGVRIIKLLVMHSSPLSCYRYLLRVRNISFYQHVHSSTLMCVKVSAITKSAWMETSPYGSFESGTSVTRTCCLLLLNDHVCGGTDVYTVVCFVTFPCGHAGTRIGYFKLFLVWD